MRRLHRVVLGNGIVAILGFALIFPALVEAGSSASSPTEVLKDLNDKVAKVLKKKLSKDKQDEQLKKIVNKMLNFKTLTKSSFGKYWSMKVDGKDVMSAEQKQKAEEMLTELIQRNYIKQIEDRQDEKYVVQYEDEEVDGKKAKVTTVVVAEGRHDEETEVVYKMVKVGSKWKVKDIETDGVSLVRNYRTQFYKIIEKESDPAEGINVLLDKLRKKVDDDEGGI